MTTPSFEQIDISDQAAHTLTVPAGASRAVVQVIGATCRYRLDGTAPTSSVGQELTTTQSVELRVSLSQAKFIATSAAGTLEVHYFFN